MTEISRGAPVPPALLGSLHSGALVVAMCTSTQQVQSQFVLRSSLLSLVGRALDCREAHFKWSSQIAYTQVRTPILSSSGRRSARRCMYIL